MDFICLRFILVDDLYSQPRMIDDPSYLDQVGFVSIQLEMRSNYFDIPSYMFKILLTTSCIPKKPT